MTDGVAYARASDDDLRELVALRYRWRVDEAGEQGDGIDQFESRFRAWYETHRATHAGYLAVLDGEAVGCAWLYTIDRVPGPARFIRRAGMLQSVYVAPRTATRASGMGPFVTSSMTRRNANSTI